jgi:hypothetical protein
MNGQQIPTPVKPWRHFINVHPAAELLPAMSENELRELADDIKKNDLVEKVELYETSNGHCVYDGRNRLDALVMLGRTVVTADGEPNWDYFQKGVSDISPVELVISKNIHRRHLTQEQKRECVAKLLKLEPARSDRQLARLVKVDHHTVARVRSDLVKRGAIPTSRSVRTRRAEISRPRNPLASWLKLANPCLKLAWSPRLAAQRPHRHRQVFLS